jgi:hypothetical protein
LHATPPSRAINGAGVLQITVVNGTPEDAYLTFTPTVPTSGPVHPSGHVPPGARDGARRADVPINSVFATSQSAAGPATTATATLDFGQRQLPADYVWPTHVETSWRPNNVCYFGSNTSPCP